MELKTQNFKKPSHILYYSLPYLVLILLSVKLSYFRYLTFGLVLLFITIILLAEKKIGFKKKYICFFLFIMGYILLSAINGDFSQIIKNTCMILLNFAPFFLSDWLFSVNRRDRLLQNSRLLLKVITLILIYTISATLYYLFKNPYIARNMANYDPSSGMATDLPLAIGGGYVLIYGIILIPPIFLYIAKSLKLKLGWRLIYFISALFLFYFIIKSGFATAFIISLAGSIISIFVTSKQRMVNRTWITISILGLAVVFLNIDLLAGLINYVIRFLPADSIIAVRLNEIIPALFGSSTDVSSFSMRLNGFDKTISAFLEQPFFGVGYKVGFDYLKVSFYTGLHTEWLDNLSQYGLILSLFYFGFIIRSFQELVQLFKLTPFNKIVKLLILMLVIVGFLNPIITTSIFVIMMIYLPALMVIITANVEKT